MIRLDQLDALTPLPPDDLPRQWRLATVPDERYAGWTCLKAGSWHLQAHPAAKVAVVVGRDGLFIGWIIGATFQNSGEEPVNRMELEVGSCEPEELERALYGRSEDGRADGTGVEGPWTAIILRGRSRVHVAAAHSVVYAPDERCVATSPSLVPNLVRDKELCRAADPQVTRSFYGFGLTPFQGVKRLLPNHVLDLHTFTPLRHWPKAGLAPYEGAEAAANRLLRGTAPILDAVAAQFDEVRISLSAGRDSRAIMALCRRISEAPGRVIAFTTLRDDLWSRIDVATAKKLAERAGIPHEVQTTQAQEASDEKVARAYVRIGEAKFGPVLASAAAAAPGTGPNLRRIHLAGMAGEVARGFYWGRSMPGRADVEPGALVRRIGMPPLPEVVSAAAEWVNGLPDAVRSQPADVLDLLFLEQRLGCWDAPARYLFPGTGTTLNLMSTSLALDTMLRLEPEIRLRGTFQHLLIQRAWPALADLPYNRPNGPQQIHAAAWKGRDLVTRLVRRMRSEAVEVLGRGRT